jgi:F5/8 type C domain
MKKTPLLIAGITALLSSCGQQPSQSSVAAAPLLSTQATNVCAPTDLALGKAARSSGDESLATPARDAFDTNPQSRWASPFNIPAADSQWLQVDLGSVQNLCQVALQWEGTAAYGKSFEIQTSTDGTTWTPIYTTTTGTGGNQTIDVSGRGQYVRMQGVKRGTGYGYSLYSMQVYATTGTGTGTGTTTCGTVNVALNKPASASSTENAGTTPNLAVDGNVDTRWSSVYTGTPAINDDQWLRLDLGSAQTVCGAKINWEAAYGLSYDLEVSNDLQTWTSIFHTDAGKVGLQELTPIKAVAGRYLRVKGIRRGSGYGYSIRELELYTSGAVVNPPPVTLPTSDTPDLGPNVRIFDPSTPAATIQAAVDQAFNAQLKSPTAQFGDQRYTFLFKPGNYAGRFFANLGFYTTLAGLGLNPDDTSLNADLNVDSGWNLGDEKNATQNFWRSAENLAITPASGTNRWAVSQAAPMRRLHIRGNLTMGPSNQDFGQGYSSGGFIADSRVDGQITSGSQQQWYTRDSTIGSWAGSNWNMVFSGVQGAPATTFPEPAYTTLATTPVSREKPYLYLDASGKYRVFVPALRTNASGVTWPNTPGTSLPMKEFYVARPADSAATLNTALRQGLNLYFTPGVYHLSQTLNVTRAGTVVTGLGFPTLVPDGGVNAIQVADVDGVNISGLLFDAGTVNSPALLTVGTAGSHINHAANPITVQDVFFRIGGAVAGKSTTSLIVNADNTIVDHIWAWRADHGNSPTGWTINTADTGLIVNGNNVLASGLFVEHYQKYEVIWNGQGGKTIFFQNEKPYDVPDNATWRAGINGYAAYKVADSVTSHEAWGLGSYAYFATNPAVKVSHSFEVPNTPNVKFHSILTVSLGNVGTIENVINNVGASVPFPLPADNTRPSKVVSYP